MTAFPIVRAIRRYVGKIQTIHNQIRTERMLESLPPELRRDIGWPSRHDERFARR